MHEAQVLPALHGEGRGKGRGGKGRGAGKGRGRGKGGGGGSADTARSADDRGGAYSGRGGKGGGRGGGGGGCTPVGGKGGKGGAKPKAGDVYEMGDVILVAVEREGGIKWEPREGIEAASSREAKRRQEGDEAQWLRKQEHAVVSARVAEAKEVEKRERARKVSRIFRDAFTHPRGAGRWIRVSALRPTDLQRGRSPRLCTPPHRNA